MQSDNREEQDNEFPETGTNFFRKGKTGIEHINEDSCSGEENPQEKSNVSIFVVLKKQKFRVNFEVITPRRLSRFCKKQKKH